MKSSWGALFAAILAFAGCEQKLPPKTALTAHPHYVLGAPYQAGGTWFYPEENYALDTTGIASVLPDGDRLTADGEIYDATELTGAMQAIQLPAVATVTDLENGRQIQLRVNDRGPPDPARVIALSARAAWLLEMPATGARVRVQLDPLMSHRVVEQIGGGPVVEVATAPRSAVSVESLPPPGAPAAARGATQVIGAGVERATGPAVPDRLPEVVRGTVPAPGTLYLRCGTFGRFDYANVRAARLAGLGGHVLRMRDGREETYAVRAGPFASIAQADAALRRALGAGVPDARISVE